MRHPSRAAALCVALAVPIAAHATDQIGYQIGGGNTNTQPVDPSHGLPVTPAAALNASGYRVTATTSASTPLVPARAGRQMVILLNLGSTPVDLGGSTVATGGGFLLPGVVNTSITLTFSGALFGVTASGSANLAVLEIY